MKVKDKQKIIDSINHCSDLDLDGITVTDDDLQTIKKAFAIKTNCEIIGNIHDNPEMLKGIKNVQL